MEQRVKNPALAGLGMLVGVGALCLGCSAPSQGATDLLGGPSTETEEEEPFDPRAPLASIMCRTPAGNGIDDLGVAIYVVSAMNHKLDAYPDFATAAGIQQVTDCQGAVQYSAAYAAYVREHPGFDDNEPLPPSPEGEAEALPVDSTAEPEPDVAKVGNAGNATTDPAVVRISFRTCTKKHPGGAQCPKAGNTWIVHSGTPDFEDLRAASGACSATFISKNWLLTSAHCITLAAIDKCMEDGKTLDGPTNKCSPRFDNYGTWTIRGAYIRDIGDNGIPETTDVFQEYTEVVGLRSYVLPSWSGTTLSHNSQTCDPLSTCYDNVTSADHDLALLYIDPAYDSRMPPRIEDGAAKRLNIVTPGSPFDFDLAIAGWGRPLATVGNNPLQSVLRRGSVPKSTVNPPGVATSSTRIEVRSPLAPGNSYACLGDSGGPVMRALPQIQTNDDVRSNLDAIVAVTATSNATCDGVTAEPNPVRWAATVVHTPAHLDFIHEQLKRWPFTVQKCVERTATSGPSSGTKQAEECWAKPCTLDSGCAKDVETCQGSPRLTLESVPIIESVCKVCKDFRHVDFDDNLLCNCIEGQCIPKLSPVP